MPVFGPEVDAALHDLSERMGTNPALREVLESIRREGLSEVEAMRRVMAVVTANPDIAKWVEGVAAEALAPLRQETGIEKPLAPPPDLVLPPLRPGGLPRMNPLYEAAIQERVQLDGDAPELRTGPLPKGAVPAVPVATDARNPVALGWMLDDASSQVAAEAKAIESRGVEEVQLLLEGAKGTDLVVRDPATLSKLERANLPDPEGYTRGQLPTLREVEQPEGWALASLTPEQQGQLAWKFLSTTQGRRSALGSIRDLVLTKLRSDGFDVVLGEANPGRVRPEDILAYAEWTVDLAGPNGTQSGFAFVDMAAAVLVRKLEEAIGGGAAGAQLEITAVNMVDMRRVGWAARLLRAGHP